ncbi:MAG: sulfur carrier protein ThiS [Actinomycetota bacterium]
MASDTEDKGKGQESVTVGEQRLPAESRKLELVVQGKKLSYIGPPDVRSLLESQGEDSLYANVRINGDILDRRDFENIQINDGDKIDFLYFMGGGKAYNRSRESNKKRCST